MKVHTAVPQLVVKKNHDQNRKGKMRKVSHPMFLIPGSKAISI